MNEFNFRVANAAPRASVFEIGQNVGDTKTTYIYSYKTKYINGKSTGQKTNVDWDMESSIPSWVSVKYAFEGNDCKVTFTTLQENTGSSARTHTLVFKQRESGQTISFPISQPNFTYTYFLSVSNVSATIGANIGDTTTIMVQSYMTRSDGEVMAKQPSVGATPSWATKVTVKDGSIMAGAPNWYQIIVEATAANLNSLARSGTLLVTCGDQRREVTILQKAAAEPDITLTIHWPLNTFSGAFFKEGQTPQNGSTGYAYLNCSILDDTSVHKYKKSKGVIVNLRDGSTGYAYPGDRISAYTFTNQTWQLLSTFLLPSSDQTITL